MNTFTKTLATTLTATVLTLSTIGTASAAPNVVAADDYITSKICAAASGKSGIKLHKTIKDSGLSKKFIAQNVNCNDQNIVSFVQDHGAKPEKMVNMLTGGQYKTSVTVIDLAAN